MSEARKNIFILLSHEACLCLIIRQIYIKMPKKADHLMLWTLNTDPIKKWMRSNKDLSIFNKAIYQTLCIGKKWPQDSEAL